MPLESLIKEKLAQLSPGQKKVADFLLMRPEQAAFLTAVQLGKEAEVSETTVIRLSYALGFNGFSDLQARIQREVLRTSGGTAPQPSAMNEAGEGQGGLTAVAERDIEIIRQLAATVNEADIWKAVDWLWSADQVMVSGYRASFGPAHWLSFMLSQCRGNVQLQQGGGDMLEKVSTMTSSSVLFVLSYPRYSKEAVQTAECAKRHGVRIIAATDRPLSPVGQLADLTFTTEENHASMFNSIASVLSLLNLIMAGIAQKHQESVQARSQELEKLYAAHAIYVE
ncbi:MAG: MurR/RpiR family transcriptional regulator [Clostridia bacterium]